MAVDLGLALQAGMGLLTAGAAFGGVKVALNGTRERVKSIDEKLDKHIASDNDVQVKLLEGMAALQERTKRRRTNAR